MKIDYRHKKISLLTKHGKEHIIAPVMERSLQCQIEVNHACDTDELGTFDGSIERQGTQLETVRRKAHIGIDLSNHTIGIASEGSFVPDPFSGFMPWNIEMVMFVDDLHAIEIVGIAQGSAMSMSRYVRDIDALMQFAEDAGFPEHHLMLRPMNEFDPRVIKGINTVQALKAAFMDALSQSMNGQVFIENDLRAFCNPTRQKMIEQATHDLVQKMQSLCPECEYPGFWKTKTETGLACSVCNRATRLPVCEIWTCNHCAHQQHFNLSTLQKANPALCDACNP